MPLVQTRGAASAQGFGEFSQPAAPANYIEDVFSTFLYTGNGTSQTISNGIALGDSSIVNPQNNTALPTFDSNYFFQAVAFGNGIYVAVGRYTSATGSYQTTSYATSTDGITWTTRTNMPSGYWIKVIYADGKFTALGGYVSGWVMSKLATSTDGINWTETTTSGYSQFYDAQGLKYTNGQYFIVGNTVSTAYRSSNGVTWTTFTPYTDFESGWSWTDIDFGNGVYALTSPSNGVFTSSNLSSWTSSTTPFNSTTVDFLNGNFYICGSTGLARSSSAATSSWTTVLSGYITDVAYNGSRFLSYDRTSRNLYVSTTGASSSWTANAANPSTEITGEIAMSSTGAALISTNSGTARYVGTVTSFTPSVIGKGGLVWIKSRSSSGEYHNLFDTVRGAANVVFSNVSDAAANSPTRLTSFNSNGFSVGSNSGTNANGGTFCSWTFREQPKFFDVVTYTGDGSDTRQVAHNLGTSPAFIIIKCTSNVEDWIVGARNSSNNFDNLRLNTTAANAGSFGSYPTGSAYVSSTTVGVGWWAMAGLATLNQVNASGRTYVAYLFAHDAGGFGLSGTDNVISCGSYVGDGSGNAVVNLGWEPQFLLIKLSGTTDNWRIFDNMRGIDSFNSTGTDQQLLANTTGAETTTNGWQLTPTGFKVTSQSSGFRVIYMAIRRGLMKTPTSGTQVFNPNNQFGSDSSTGNFISTGFPVDSSWINTTDGNNTHLTDRLRASSRTFWNRLVTPSAADEATTNAGAFGPGRPFLALDTNTGVQQGVFGSAQPMISWSFRRAPGFFDTVCYGGTGAAQTINHNLGVVPELIILKGRNTGPSVGQWAVNVQSINTNNWILSLESTDARFNNALFSSAPTASSMTFSGGQINNSGANYVAYLFATVTGVSKVGTYAGTGATQTINCGFTSGARFVLIKRTNNTGNWWVWDTARGMVSGTDPRIALNSTSAQINNDWVLTVSTGFQIVTTDADVNASGGSYIFLAIA